MAGFPKAGDEYGGRYRIVRQLGHGGMGIVYEAIDKVLNRSVALKIVLPSLPDREGYQTRFAREASVLAKIRSRHIVGIHEYGEHDDTVFFVTELFPDGDLQTWLTKNGPLERRAALLLVAQVCEALADAHAAAVIHRDVKPGNVLLWSRADGLIPYLCDFGIALDGQQGLTRTGALVGSPAYMAPERHFGHPADERGDVYSVGCLLWATLSGDAPYSGTDFQMMNSHINEPTPQLATGDPIDDRIDQILDATLQKDPERRVASAAEVRTRLLDLVKQIDSGVVTGPTPPPVPPRPIRPTAAQDIRTQLAATAAPPRPAEPLRPANHATPLPPLKRKPVAQGGGPRTMIRDLPPAPPAPPPPTPDDGSRRRRTLLLLAAAVVVLLAVGGVVWGVTHRDGEPSASPTDEPTTSPPTSSTTTPATPLGRPDPARVTADSGYRSVAFEVKAPTPPAGVAQRVDYRASESQWKKAGQRVVVPTRQGGDRTCIQLRTTWRTGEDSKQAVSRACGRAEPRTVRFVASPDPCTNQGYPCTYYDVAVTGFATGASPLAKVQRVNGQPWCTGGTACSWDHVHVGKDGRGGITHDWAISRDEGLVILDVDGVTARFHLYVR